MEGFTHIWIALDAHLTLEGVVVHGNGHAGPEPRHGDLVVGGLHLARLLPESLHLQHRHGVAIEGDELESTSVTTYTLSGS